MANTTNTTKVKATETKVETKVETKATPTNPFGATGDLSVKPTTVEMVQARLVELTTVTKADGTKGYRPVMVRDLETALVRTGDGKAIRNIIRSVLGPNAPTDANGNKVWVFKVTDPAFVTILGKLVAKGTRTGSRVSIDPSTGFYTL